MQAIVSVVNYKKTLMAELNCVSPTEFHYQILREDECYSYFSRLSVIAVNPLNAELNPICCLLALLGAHHFLHVSRIRVKSLTLRLLMSYIYRVFHDFRA